METTSVEPAELAEAAALCRTRAGAAVLEWIAGRWDYRRSAIASWCDMGWMDCGLGSRTQSQSHLHAGHAHDRIALPGADYLGPPALRGIQEGRTTSCRDARG